LSRSMQISMEVLPRIVVFGVTTVIAVAVVVAVGTAVSTFSEITVIMAVFRSAKGIFVFK